MLSKLISAGLALGLAATIATTDTCAGDNKGEKMILTDKPLTIKVESGTELRAGLTAAAEPKSKVAVTLTLGDVVPPAQREQVEGVRVFLNKEDATREAATDDPHFVTVFAFPPTTCRGPQEFNLDLTRAVGALGRAGQFDPAKPLRITLVPVPAHGTKELPADFSVPVGKVSVTTAPVK
jgi:hypothetical protein